jgi:hypothetical protein
MSEEEGERWIVNLIRNSDQIGGHRGDARIDCKGGQVVMRSNAPNVWETVIEKVRSLPERSEAILSQTVKRHAAMV